MEEGVVGEQRDGECGAAPERRQLAHPFEVCAALRVDEGLDRATRQDREDDLGEERRLEVRLRAERLAQPSVELPHPVVGDRVAAAIRSRVALDGVEPDLAALLEPAERRVDLRERERPVGREVSVEEPLQVVPVPRFLFEKAEEAVLNAHGRHYTLS